MLGPEALVCRHHLGFQFGCRTDHFDGFLATGNHLAAGQGERRVVPVVSGECSGVIMMEMSCKRPQAAWLPRCAQPVVCFSIQLNSSYMTMAMMPTTSRPLKARPICMELPAEMSR